MKKNISVLVKRFQSIVILIKMVKSIKSTLKNDLLIVIKFEQTPKECFKILSNYYGVEKAEMLMKKRCLFSRLEETALPPKEVFFIVKYD